jgi:FkbM family methyltransferase
MGPIRSFPFESDFFNLTCHEILVGGKPIRYVDSTPVAYSLLTSLFESEPTTIPWLESFRSDETLVDIGASIGMYSTYAAALTGCRVFAFEPESLKYAELNKNIFVNHLYDRVSAFCMVLTNEVRIGFLNLDAPGRSHSAYDFSEGAWVSHMQGGERSTDETDRRLRQACISSTLDTLVESGIVPAPNHIRIDVPGLQHDVIAGCRRTLASPALQSVLIEIDFQSVHTEPFLDMMTGLGWKYSMDQLRTHRNFILPLELIHTLRSEKRGRMNHIFFRNEKYVQLFRDFLADYEPPYPLPKTKVAELIQQGRLS